MTVCQFGRIASLKAIQSRGQNELAATGPSGEQGGSGPVD